jgi:hypothetical protein
MSSFRTSVPVRISRELVIQYSFASTLRFCTFIAQRQETRDELIYRFNLANAKSEIMSKLSSPWILLLAALLVSALISMAAATGSTEIFESRGIKSANGGDETKPQKGITTASKADGGASDIATSLRAADPVVGALN